MITPDEWPGTRHSFDIHDVNGDGVLSGNELDERTDAAWFDRLDVNRNGVLDWNEWDAGWSSFLAADRNGDMNVSRAEFLAEARWPGAAGTAGYDTFTALDRDHNGVITWTEWNQDPSVFAELDRNRDGRLSRVEYEAAGAAGTAGTVAAPSPAWQRAYQAGHQRGLADGHKAGREDRVRNQGWDLEGQRELVTADAGYSRAVGPHDAYHAGYRDGFRQGYPEGYGRR